MKVVMWIFIILGALGGIDVLFKWGIVKAIGKFFSTIWKKRLGKWILISIGVLLALVIIDVFIVKGKISEATGNFFVLIYKLKLPDIFLLVLISVMLSWIIFLNKKVRDFLGKNIKEILNDTKRLIEINDGLREKVNELISENKLLMNKINSFIRVTEEIRIEFDVNQELNHETLRSFLDAYFPNTPKPKEKGIDSLCNELSKYGETFSSLKSKYQKTGRYLNTIEEAYYPDGRKFTQVQVVRHIILDLTNDAYWNDRKGKQPQLKTLKEVIRRDL